MAISTNGTVLARLAGALYNTQMSNATYSEVKTLDPAALANALYARDFSSSTDLAVATTLVTNLGLTSVTGLANWVAAQLTAAGTANKGAKVVDLLNGFAQMTADTTYGAYATAFNTKVDAALVLSQTTGNAGGTFAAAGVAPAAVGAVFALTAGIDAWTGGAGDDTVNATQSTFGISDVLNAGTGNDTLSIVDTGAAGFSTPSALVSGFENVTIRNVNGTPAVAAVAGVTAVNEIQTVTVTGASTSTSTEFLGVATTVVASDSAAITGGKIIANKVNILAGQVAKDLGIIDITAGATNDLIKLTFGGANGKGDVAPIAAWTVNNGVTFSAGVQTVQGVLGVVAKDAIAAAGYQDTVAAGTFVGATSFANDNSTSDVSFTGLASGQSVTINGNTATSNGATSAAWGSTVTSPVLNITGGTTGSGAVSLTSAGATTTTINSNGVPLTSTGLPGTNTIGTLSTGGTSTSTVAIHAASNLTTGAYTSASKYITVDGAATSVSFGSTAIAGGVVTSIDASGMTAGGVTVVLPTATTVFKGGAGTDIVTTAGATLGATAVIDGGAGSSDRLVLANSTDVATATEAAKYINFEQLQVGAFQADASLVAGITSIRTAGNSSVINLNATQAAAITATNTNANPTLALKDASGTADVMTITASNSSSAANVTGLSLTGVETLNFRNSSAAANTLSFATGASSGTTNTGLKNLVVTGAKGVTVDLNSNSAGTNTTYGNQVATLLSVDASGLTAQATGTNTFTLQDTNGGHALANGLTITGSAGDDVISLGAGTDTLAAGVVATINSGAGNDSVTVSAAQLYTSGSGYVVVNGGDNGTTGDTLTINDSTLGTLSDNAFAHVSGIESVVLSTSGTAAVNAGGYFQTAFGTNGAKITATSLTSTATFTEDLTLFTGTSTSTITTAGTGAISVTGGQGANTVTISTASTAANSVIVTGGAAADTISVTDTGVFATGGNIVINGGAGADKVTLVTADHTNAVSVVTLTVNPTQSNVGAADQVTGFYVTASTRKVDTIDFAGSAIKPASGVASTAVTGESLTSLAFSVTTAGLLAFTGTKATALTAAQVENIWTTQISTLLNNLETVVWADANTADTQYGNSLVFNHNILGDSEVILVGVQATATGAAAATANLVGIA